MATNQDNTVELQRLLDRIEEGDASARRELLSRAYERMQALALTVLGRSFPDLARRHDVESILNETWLRMVQALEKAHPPTVADFFRLAAHKMRHVLLDLVRSEERHAHGHLAETADERGAATPAAANLTYDPARLAMWTDMHRQVESLDDEERAIFEMHYYLGMPQAEIAKVLALHPRKVSYLWLAATDKLADRVSEDLVRS